MPLEDSIRMLEERDRPEPVFRFLDLPVELRLQIASYAVADGLGWPMTFH